MNIKSTLSSRLVAISAVVLALPTVASAAPRAVDGMTQATAAASCWEVKQQFPASSDGAYWLMTPQLRAPQQFYCDMTTDGGGWVLVGRGRDGWRAEYEGLGTADEVRNVVTGEAAFAPKQLHGRTIDALLGGGRVDALVDGIRLRRATNSAGTTWQETRFNLAGRDRWTWTFRARHPISLIQFDGTSVSPGTQRSNTFGSDSSFRRVITDITASQGWSGGFAFGSSVTGTSSSTSYLWSFSDGLGSARPFTQVFIRPRLLTDDLAYPAIGNGGSAAIAQVPLAESGALPQPWGVSGLASNGGQSSELRSEVQDFAQIGNVMYVGGNFRYVQRNAAGLDQVEQSYLAGFDVNTGEWVSSFRPTFNNQIKSLVALPNGLLAVGGEFSTLNGNPVSGLVVVNPTTGQAAPGYNFLVENRLVGETISIRSLKVQGPWLYLAGSFTHITGGSSTSARYMRHAGRINWSSALPDANWNPNFNGTVNEITPSADGTRVYAAGYFTTSNGVSSNRLAALSSANGAALIPWATVFSTTTARSQFQFTVSESPSQVWAGGSQHSFFSYDKGSLQLTSGSISMSGGDFQTSVVGGNVAYAGCHCGDYIYTGTTVYPWPTVFTQGEKLGYIAAWDEATGEVFPEFAPKLDARNGYGAWSSAVDSNGTLWVGGSFLTSVSRTGSVQFSGGFVRFAQRDSTAPASPSNLAGVINNGNLALTWAGAGEANLTYEVIVDDRVIATTQGLSMAIPAPSVATRYFVRAADSAGNRSASTPAVTIDPGAVPVETTVVAKTAGWRWRYMTEGVVGWMTPTYDDTSWPVGAAPLGWGSAGIATNISVGAPSPRPLAAQFRTTFEVADPNSLDEVRVTFIADDGVIVYLNGQEISRRNLPAGTIGQNTYATAAPRNSVAEAGLVTVTLPASALVAGTNTLAAETHLNYRSTPDTTFHLTATTIG